MKNISLILFLFLNFNFSVHATDNSHSTNDHMAKNFAKRKSSNSDNSSFLTKLGQCLDGTRSVNTGSWLYDTFLELGAAALGNAMGAATSYGIFKFYYKMEDPFSSLWPIVLTMPLTFVYMLINMKLDCALWHGEIHSK